MSGLSGSIFGEALPIVFDRVRPTLESLDEATRLDAISAAIPVFDRMKRLQDRLARHTGKAFITVTGWLREGRFAFFFELNAVDMQIVGLVVETVPPDDDPDGALAFLFYLEDRVRVWTALVPAPAGIGAAALATACILDRENASSDHRTGIGIFAPRPVGMASPARIGFGLCTRADLANALTGIVVLAHSVIAATSRRLAVRTGGHQATHERSGRDALGCATTKARALLRQARGSISLATVRVAQRRVRSLIGPEQAFRQAAAMLEELVACGHDRMQTAVGAVLRRRRAALASKDGAQVRAIVDHAHRTLAQGVKLMAMEDQFFQSRLDTPDFRATVADLVGASPRADVWTARRTINARSDQDEAITSQDMEGGNVLIVEQPLDSDGPRAFFVTKHRQRTLSDDLGKTGLE